MKILSIVLQLMEVIASLGLTLLGINYLIQVLEKAYSDAKGLFKSDKSKEKK